LIAVSSDMNLEVGRNPHLGYILMNGKVKILKSSPRQRGRGKGKIEIFILN
jgi:hypothetical protein